MKADLPRETVDELKGGSLSTVDAVAMAIAVLSPAMAMAYNTSFAASAAGGSTPLAFLPGGGACLTLAFVVIGFTRRMASAGYAYTYTSRTLGQGPGFLTGWLYFFGFFCFVPMTMSGVGGFTRDLIQTEWWHGMPKDFWIVIFLIGMALLVFIAVTFAILFYVWTTYVISIGVGVNNGAKWAGDPTVLADTATTYSGHLLSVLISIAAII